MGIRGWLNGLRQRQVPSPGPAPDPEIARWRKALSDFGYPYDLVSGSSAHEAFASAKLVGRENGFVPIVVVPGHWNSIRIAPDERSRRAREMLQWTEFGAADGRQFLADGLLVMHDDREFDPGCPDPDQFDKLEPKESEVVSTGLSIARRFVVGEAAQRPWDQVAIVRVPAASSDELPAYFEWGGWNAALSPHWIVAVARHWKQTYGSELVAMGPDLLEFHVLRKPPDHTAAVSLLKEHYVFAPDSFEFDRALLERAAAYLRANTSWVFWWD
jgi:hypothetical protein